MATRHQHPAAPAAPALVQPNLHRRPIPEDTTTTPPTETRTLDLLTIDQAAAHIGMSPRYVRRLIAERRIAFHRLGRAVRIHPADLAAHVHSGRVEPLTRTTVWNDLRSVA